jgi:hypothetical protein
VVFSFISPDKGSSPAIAQWNNQTGGLHWSGLRTGEDFTHDLLKTFRLICCCRSSPKVSCRCICLWRVEQLVFQAGYQNTRQNDCHGDFPFLLAGQQGQVLMSVTRMRKFRTYKSKYEVHEVGTAVEQAVQERILARWVHGRCS